MPHYFALVEKELDSAFGVIFPDAPNCFSACDDLNDVVKNATEALSFYAEDAELPVPRSIDELKLDKSIAAALAQGAFLISVPVIENDARVVRANITMEAGLLSAIDETAKARKLTRSAFLAQAARREIGA